MLSLYSQVRKGWVHGKAADTGWLQQALLLSLFSSLVGAILNNPICLSVIHPFPISSSGAIK